MKKLLIITQKVNVNDQLLGFFIEWLRRFAGKFGKITVLCLEKGEFNLPENVEVISLGKDDGESKFKQLFNFFSLIFNLKNEYDAVFIHMNPIWVVLGGPLWRLMGKKIFFWYTSGGVTSKLKLAEKFADVIFTASKESFRLPSKKVIVTGHGIDTELFKPDDNKKPSIRNIIKILSVGRISPVKNYGTLVAAVKVLKDRSIDFSVTVAGEAALGRDKEYEKKLRDQVADYKLQENFNFAGKIEHEKLPELYRSHDIFVHLSKTGSLDKALLEAMACGMKVLSSNDSSGDFLPEQLIFEENNPQELADKILALFKTEIDNKLRDYVVENHNLDKLINKISSIIVK